MRVPTLSLLLLLLALPATATGPERLPWREAGLDAREAAAHLLDRFAFGPRPGEVDRVVAVGLERWLEAQLGAPQPDPGLDPRLAALDSLGLSAAEMASTYPPGGAILALARSRGLLPEPGETGGPGAGRPGEDPELRHRLLELARDEGFRRHGELIGDLLSQKVLRALLSENQLREVLVDFWFNHLSVSLDDPECRSYVLAYERDVIRPSVLGSFRDMLGASARHPAMLLYLDNARSTADPEARTLLQVEAGRLRGQGGHFDGRAIERRVGEDRARQVEAGRPMGLNENYARELLELHTLGVDGGYTQDDVVEVARVFSGWSVVPPGPAREMAEERLAQVGRLGGLGFQRDGDFVFRADVHDAGSKVVLGARLPAGGGVEEGEAVLDLLARHPATARHLATRLALRFVSDDPPAALVDELATVYLDTRGDLAAVVRAIASSPHFWSPAAVHQKVKSPFELAVSAVRATGAELTDPAGLVEAVAEMGQPLYAAQAPTGYPAASEGWVNTGALLARMSFGLELAAGRIGGVAVDWNELLGGREPESATAALEHLASLLLPGRNVDEAVAQLASTVGAPGLESEVATRLEQRATPSLTTEASYRYWEEPFPSWRREKPSTDAPTALAQVGGVLLGSPEFQRR